MYRLKLVPAALLALPLVALGCGPQRADTRAPSQEATAMPAPAAAVTVDLGSTVGSDGRVEGHSDAFKRGEPIIAAIDATTLKTGTGVQVNWVGPQSDVRASEEFTVPPDARMITFKSQDTSGWPAGNYRLDFNVAGRLIGSKNFTLG